MSALQEGNLVTMPYLKLLFLGPPGTGKSTARRRLLREIVNLSKDCKPTPSSGIAECSDVIIKKLTSDPVAISGSNWWSFKKHGQPDMLIDSEVNLEYLTQLFSTFIVNSKSRPNTVSSAESESDSSIHESESNVSQNKSEETQMTDAAKSAGDIETITPNKLQDQQRRNMPITQLQANLPNKSRSASSVNEAFEKLEAALKSDSPEDFRKVLEDLMMLNMVDIGGQPAFLELCPAFTTGPALYLIFFRLDQELKKKYPIIYRRRDGQNIELESSYCTETVIHQTLSSIDCFGSRASAHSAESAPLPNVSGRALLFGTYKDEVVKISDKCISDKDTTLRQQLEHTKLYRENLLLEPSQDVTKFLFYSLNNMTGNDSEMSPIRKDIENIITNKNFFPDVPIPSSWLMFRIVLHFLHKSVVSLTVCEVIANRLFMNTPVREAIWFFHHNIGSLMHYPDIPSMKDIVICDPQVVFDTTSELIIDTFKKGNRSIDQTAVQDFHSKGVFSLAHIKDKTDSECNQNNELSHKQLVELLKHHNIIAEISPGQGSSKQPESIQQISPQFTTDKDSSTQAESDPKVSAQTKKCQPIFIMPAVLQDASEEELSSAVSEREAAPLMIHFESGFVPFGVFCASVANLIAHQDSMLPTWQLDDDQMKNKVNFVIDQSFNVTLISRPQYLEIQVQQYEGTSSDYSLSYICSSVRQIFVQTLETVISKMKHTPYVKDKSLLLAIDQSFDLAFTCCLHGGHLMKVDKEKLEGKCLVKRIPLRVKTLKDNHLIWFSQVSYSKSFMDLTYIHASVWLEY